MRSELNLSWVYGFLIGFKFFHKEELLRGDKFVVELCLGIICFTLIIR